MSYSSFISLTSCIYDQYPTLVMSPFFIYLHSHILIMWLLSLSLDDFLFYTGKLWMTFRWLLSHMAFLTGRGVCSKVISFTLSSSHFTLYIAMIVQGSILQLISVIFFIGHFIQTPALNYLDVVFLSWNTLWQVLLFFLKDW